MANIEMNNRVKKVYIDGSSEGFYGYIIDGEEPVIFHEPDELTNNQAEWLALYSLVVSLPVGWEGVVYSDSQLVVCQFKGEYQINAFHLKQIHDLVKHICKAKNLSLELVWIPREENILGRILDKYVKGRKEHEDTIY